MTTNYQDMAYRAIIEGPGAIHRCCGGMPTRPDYDAACQRLFALHPDWRRARILQRAMIEMFTVALENASC